MFWKFGSIRKNGQQKKIKMLWKIDWQEGENNRLMKMFWKLKLTRRGQ
jgi:hypothetical protein